MLRRRLRKLFESREEHPEADSGKEHDATQKKPIHPHARIDERVNRCVSEDTAASEEGAIQDSDERKQAENKIRPDERAALALVQRSADRGDTEQPGNQRRIFYGIPTPEAPPAKCLISPPPRIMPVPRTIDPNTAHGVAILIQEL